MRKERVVIVLFLLAYSLICSADEPIQLRIIWHAGVLGERLNEIAKEYTEKTGVAIHVQLVPWDQWHDKIAADFASRTGLYDLTIFDSQSMSEFASHGHVLLLNSYLKKSPLLRARDFDPTSLNMYAEFPEGSARFYALPVNQDTMGLVYRKDLFEDPQEKKAFKAKYGYDLAAPETYDQLKDIAEFFTRPAQKLYGIAIFGSEKYDAVTSTFNNMLWSFGGGLWDSKTRKVTGIIDSASSVAALEYFRKLFDYTPPGGSNWFYDEVNRAVHSGQVATAINWYYFFAAHADPSTNPFASKTAFATLPGEKGQDGKFRRFNMVGGQGMSISAYTKHREDAWKFLEWFMSKDVQRKWVRAGAQTGRIDILRSPEYSAANSYNSAFAISMGRVKDYWHLVEYPQLLAIYQNKIHKAITGELSASEALSQAALEQQKIIDQIK